MDPKDTFFKKLQPLEDFAKLFEKSERFGSWNQKTLGIVLVSDDMFLESCDTYNCAVKFYVANLYCCTVLTFKSKHLP